MKKDCTPETLSDILNKLPTLFDIYFISLSLKPTAIR